jgi:hypothetical protein
MVSSAVRNAFFRPTRSPKCPQTTPPRGRARNATPKTLKVNSAAAVGFAFGKNTLGKMRAAAVPKMKKSYHSMADPTALMLAILRMDRSSSRSVPGSCAVVMATRCPHLVVGFTSERGRTRVDGCDGCHHPITAS